MKELIPLLCFLCLVSCGKENDVWQWKTDRENTLEDVEFPQEGRLRLIKSKEDILYATLELAYQNPTPERLSDGDVLKAVVSFEFDGMPYQMKDNNGSIRLYANELPGRVFYRELEYGTDLYYSYSLTGRFSFDSTLEFQTKLIGRRSLTPGDELRCSWVVRFESNEGERFFFRVSKVSVY